MATVIYRGDVPFEPINVHIRQELKQAAKKAGLKFSILLSEAIEQKLAETDLNEKRSENLKHASND